MKTRPVKEEKPNYDRLARQMVRSLRGKRSQVALSRRLRYKTNVVATWESGRRQPTIADLLHVATTAKVTLQENLERFFSDRTIPWATNAINDTFAVELVRELTLGHSAIALASALGTSRVTVGRWLQGASSPKLSQLLKLVNFCSHRLVEFVEVFVHPETVPEISELYATLQSQRQLAYEHPWSHAVMRATELAGYAESGERGDEFIAAALGVSAELVRDSMAGLVAAGQLRRTQRGWLPVDVLAVDTQKDPARNLRLKQHWATEGLRQMSLGSRPKNLFSYNLFAISDEGLAQIEALHRAYFEQVREIVSSCSTPTRVAVMNLQLFSLDGRE